MQNTNREKKKKTETENGDYIPGARGHDAGRMRRVILPRPWSQVWYIVCDM
jgi:hypothetical protein